MTSTTQNVASANKTNGASGVLPPASAVTATAETGPALGAAPEPGELPASLPAGGQQLAEEEELLDEFGLDQFDSTSTPVDELNAQIATLQAQLVAAQANNQQAGSLVAQVQRGLQNLARFPGPPPGRPAAPSADSEGPPPASGYCYHCGLSSHWTKHCKRKASGMSKEEAMKDAGTWELMQDLKKGGSAPYKAAKRDRSPDRGGDPGGPSRQYQGRRPQTARMEANGMVKHFQKYQRK